MPYTPKTWQTGEVIKATDLNHLEQGVASAIGGSGGDVDLSTYAPKTNPQFQGIVKVSNSGASIDISNNSVQVGESHETQDDSLAVGTHNITSYHAIASGQYCKATGANSFAQGSNSEASGDHSIACGYAAKAIGMADSAFGLSTIANSKNSSIPQFVCGFNNIEAEGIFVVGGNGGNAFRVTETNVYGGTYSSTGADYAEMFEWEDGNNDGEDRRGKFVTLSGEKIRIATQEDDYVLGIISGNPSVLCDVHDDQWSGAFLHDIFGAPIWEDVKIPDKIGPDGKVIIPVHTEHRKKPNPDYDSSWPYIPRSKRPEWSAVGMLGKLVAVDDGTCQPNGWAAVGEGGIAVASEARTRYRVMSRLDDTHVRILIL